MGESSKKEKKSKKKEKKTEEEAEAPKDEGGDDAAAEDKPEPKRAARGTSNVFALFNQSQIQEFKEAFTMIDQNRDGIICEEDLGAIYQQIGRDPDPAVLAKMIKEAPGQLNFTHFLTLFGEKLHGRDPDPAILGKMINESPVALNFTSFLGLFGDKLKGRDPKPEIIKKMVEESPTALNFTSFLTLLGGKLTGTDSESCLRDAFTMFDENKVGTLSEDYMKDLLTNVGDIFSKDELKALWKEAPIEGGQFDYLKMTRIIKRGDEDE